MSGDLKVGSIRSSNLVKAIIKYGRQSFREDVFVQELFAVYAVTNALTKMVNGLVMVSAPPLLITGIPNQFARSVE